MMHVRRTSNISDGSDIEMQVYDWKILAAHYEISTVAIKWEGGSSTSDSYVYHSPPPLMEETAENPNTTEIAAFSGDRKPNQVSPIEPLWQDAPATSSLRLRQHQRRRSTETHVFPKESQDCENPVSKLVF